MHHLLPLAGGGAVAGRDVLLREANPGGGTGLRRERVDEGSTGQFMIMRRAQVFTAKCRASAFSFDDGFLYLSQKVRITFNRCFEKLLVT